jgi:broad specificity phosphatase PhoE
MKEVYVLRHANWDGKEDTLSKQGKESAQKLSTQLPSFVTVYASPFERTRQTASILSEGLELQVNTAASVPETPSEIREQVLAKRTTHPLGIAGALFEEPNAHPALLSAGTALTKLIQATLSELRDEQRALIVSHDGTMMAAKRILENTDFITPLDHTYGELEGFIVNENLEIKKYVQ